MNNQNRLDCGVIPALVLLLAALLVLNSCHKPSIRDSDDSPKTRVKETGGSFYKRLRLSAAQLADFGVLLDVAGPGKLQAWLSLPGEIAVNADRVAHIVPRVTGVVREVRRNVGDQVQKGEVMAVLESRELADSKAAFLAARQRSSLAESNYNREEQLWKKKISAEQDYIQAKNALAEAQIELQTTEQKLRTLGLSDDQIATVVAHPERNLTRYEMVAPFEATIVEKHIDLGEVLKDDTPGFKIADLQTVWANLDVQQKDFPQVHKGQKVILTAAHGIPDVTGSISYIEPLVNEQTRTLHARVVIFNRDGKWQPGLFVTGRILVQDLEATVLVSNEALIMIGGRPSVFVQTDDGFKAQGVSTGRASESQTEILSGLNSGQTYVKRGAFTLKSEMEKPQTDE